MDIEIGMGLERILTVLLSLGLGLGVGLLLVGELHAPTTRGRKEQRILPDEAYRPWQGVPLSWAALVFAFVALLAVVVLTLAGPILSLAAGLVLLEIAILSLSAARERAERRVHSQALGLAEALASAVARGATLPDAFRAYVRRHEGRPLAREVQIHVLAPLESGIPISDVLGELAESPRYRSHFLLQRLLGHLARAVRAELTPEELGEELAAFLDTAEMIDEAQQELLVDATQTRYTRWVVIGIIGGGILFIAIVMPGARQHWLHDLVGQITVLLMSMSVVGATAMGERLTKLKPWRF